MPALTVTLAGNYLRLSGEEPSKHNWRNSAKELSPPERRRVPDSIDGHMVDVVEGRASLEQALMDHLDPAGAAARALKELL